MITALCTQNDLLNWKSRKVHLSELCSEMWYSYSKQHFRFFFFNLRLCEFELILFLSYTLFCNKLWFYYYRGTGNTIFAVQGSLLFMVRNHLWRRVNWVHFLHVFLKIHVNCDYIGFFDSVDHWRLIIVDKGVVLVSSP